MIETVLTSIEEINISNIDQIQGLYENFYSRYSSDYRFEIQPLVYEDFKRVISEKIIQGFILSENFIHKGFLIYVIEPHKAIELNIIHLIDNENLLERRKSLINALLDKFKGQNNWNVISYPMLGIQETFVRDIAPIGFKLIGQAIVKFKFDNLISYNILLRLNLPDLPEGYSLTGWKDEYLEQASQVIHDTFKNSSDAKFDPRFLTLEGSRDVVNKIVTNVFGLFLPEDTSVLLHNDQVAGVCFAVVTDALSANIPLIGVKKEYKNKKLGEQLLKNTVASIAKNVEQGKIYVTDVNAAVDTDNFAATRMYRKIGFREEYTYPHAYFKNPDFCG